MQRKRSRSGWTFTFTGEKGQQTSLSIPSGCSKKAGGRNSRFSTLLCTTSRLDIDIPLLTVWFVALLTLLRVPRSLVSFLAFIHGSESADHNMLIQTRRRRFPYISFPKGTISSSRWWWWWWWPSLRFNSPAAPGLANCRPVFVRFVIENLWCCVGEEYI